MAGKEDFRLEMGDWDPDIHRQQEQIVRLQRSRLISSSSILSEDEDSITIKGSGRTPYVTTLQGCSCADFEMRMKPCKHMYFLAFRKGLIDETALDSLGDIGDDDYARRLKKRAEVDKTVDRMVKRVMKGKGYTGLLKYSGYVGSVNYNKQTATLYGEVLGIGAAVSYEGENTAQLVANFQQAVNVYLYNCLAEGVEPDRPWDDGVKLALPHELCSRLARAAAGKGVTLDSYVEKLLSGALR